MLKAIIVAVIVLCSSCAYAWTWVNIDSQGNGSAMETGGKTTWFTVSE